MDVPVKGRTWRRCRTAFRAFRIGMWLLVLVLVAAAAYLNEVGLPDFLKRPLLAELRSRGVDLEFSRLRLRWNRGVVAENVRFGGAGQETNTPQLALKEVEVKLDHASLARFHFRVDALVLNDGWLRWPVPDTNGPLRELELTNIQARLRFLTNDQWELDHLTAAIDGARLELAGSVTNASRLREWKIFQPQPEKGPGMWRERLQQFVDTMDRLKFSMPPELAVRFGGDAREPESFGGSLTVKAPGVETPWGTLTNGEFMARLSPPGAATNQLEAEAELRAAEAVLPLGRLSNLVVRLHATPLTAPGAITNLLRAEVELRADEAVLRSARARDLVMRLHAAPLESLTNGIAARLEASAGELSTEWMEASGAAVKAEWTHALTNWMPQSGTAEVQLTNARMNRASAGVLDLSARLNPPDGTGSPATDGRWGWWADLAPYSLDWNCHLKDVQAEDPNAGKFAFKELGCGGSWRAPELTLTNAHAELYRGKLDASARLNVVNRELVFAGTEDFDVQKVAPLLPEGARRWLEQYSWENPPLVHAAGGVVLPDWTNSQPDWRGEVRPTLWLQGEAAAGNAGFRGVPVTAASLHFYYSNLVWNVPDLVAERPEGRLELLDEADDRTQQYHFHLKSTVDPKAMRGLVPPEGQPGLDAFIFTQPPVIEADVWGRWHEPDVIGVKAHVIITNFALRGESATRFEGNVQYTNKYVILTDSRVDIGGRYLSASGLGVDLGEHLAYVTNGVSTMAPGPFFHVIGPKVAKVMEPYQFSEPPTVRAYGAIPLAEDADPDLHFQVDGGPFHWMKFNVDHISGGVDWVGKMLTLTNVQAEFYQGRMQADAVFDFMVDPGADFSFNVAVADTSLQALMADVSAKTNRMEGRLTGNLNITNANTESFGNWSGKGRVELRDGLIWAIPVFGIFSQVLDKVSPGLGESRAKNGAATFTIVNSVIRSDDLVIQAPALEMMYRGTVDFNGRVNATVEAQLLRELPFGLGYVVNAAIKPLTWLFEYKVTGTLDVPKSEPVFPVTRIPMFFLTPMQSLKDLAPVLNPPATNAPPPAPAPEPTPTPTP